MLPYIASLLSAACLASAASLPRADSSPQPRLPSRWYHEEGHPVHALFRRDPASDGYNYPAVGTPDWAKGYPDGKPASISKIPQAWKDALDKAVSAGKIPNIPPSTSTNGGNPTYPKGLDPNSANVCSATYKCRIQTDLWDAPSGVFAVSFDDGPLPPTTKLVQFLDQHNISSCHFMIGYNILNNPTQFQQVFSSGADVAVHTWSHRYTTTLSNSDVVAELGWTMQLIHNSTGGRVPRYWRPPYGDSDVRTSAIAREVFGMQTVIWNQDTEDWSISSGGTTEAKVDASLAKWITGPKSPGIIPLEHELTDVTVDAFMKAYPAMTSNGWNLKSVAEIGEGDGAYQNSENNEASVNPAGIILGTAQNSTSSSGAPQGSSAPSSSGSSNNNSKANSASSFNDLVKATTVVVLTFSLFMSTSGLA